MARTIDRGLWEQWRARLLRFESWDGTVGEFCRREDVSQALFYQWWKKLRSGTDSRRPAAFVPVLPRMPDLASRTSEAAGVVLVTLASGARVEIPAAAGTLVERVVLALDGQGVGDQS